MASWGTTVSASGFPILPGSSAARRGSISTATTRDARPTSRRVSAPRPGPISSTSSFGPISAESTIRRAILRSIRKFWPRRVWPTDARRKVFLEVGISSLQEGPNTGWLKAVHHRSIPSAGISNETNSSQVVPRRPEITAYRCFLPNLTGFTALRRVGPSSQHRSSPTVADGAEPLGGIQPR